ncbi:MAG: hypothetical protein ABI824_09185 [Acidobacteriota bacterium]
MRQAATKKQAASAARKTTRAVGAPSSAESEQPTPHRNVTLSLPEPLLRRFRVYAAEQNQSMTHIAAQAITKWMEQSDERQRAVDRMIARMENPPGRSAGGKITWTRDELYDREPSTSVPKRG